MTDPSNDDNRNEQPTELATPTPTPEDPIAPRGAWASAASGSGRPVAGDSTDGERDTTAPHLTDEAGDVIGSDGARGRARGEPDGIAPKAGYPSKDPRSSDAPYNDAE